MISAFRVFPAASGRGLCDVNGVKFTVTQSRVKKWDVQVGRSKSTCINFRLARTSQFFTRD